MDMATISAAIGSIKTATDIAKFIKDSDISLEKAELKLKLADLVSALADAKIELANVQQSLADADSKIRELEAHLAKRASVKYEKPAYWVETERGRDGPFCQRCHDTKDRLVRLQERDNGYLSCFECKGVYETEASRAYEREMDRRIHSASDPF